MVITRRVLRAVLSSVWLPTTQVTASSFSSGARAASSSANASSWPVSQSKMIGVGMGPLRPPALDHGSPPHRTALRRSAPHRLGNLPSSHVRSALDQVWALLEVDRDSRTIEIGWNDEDEMLAGANGGSKLDEHVRIPGTRLRQD